MTVSLLPPRGKKYLLPERQRLTKNKLKQVKYYDKGAKNLEVLQEGDTVRVQPFKKSQKAWGKSVVSKPISQRSYEIKTAK